MSEERFDCIIVGGGLAGLTVAYLLANEGLEVLLLEKGNYSGSKNMTGGRLYGNSLERIIPGFADIAPVERRVVKERLSIMKDTVMQMVEYDASGVFVQEQEGESYTVLRGKFDKWLSEQAEDQGAMLVCGIRVDDLIIRDGKVCGVVANDEEMESDVVLLADGVNSLLTQKLGYKNKLGTNQVAVGVKEIIDLGADVINQRFNLSDGEGIAWMFVDSNEVCDGFLYTNKDSLSVGVTLKVENIHKAESSVPQMLEDFKKLPEIAPLVSGGRLVEYSAHLIPEGGMDMVPKLYGDGVLVAGDAAALCANLGFTLRGMDLAVESGRLAAEAILAAKEKGEFSEQSLSGYQTAIEKSAAISCVKGAEICRKAVTDADSMKDPLDAFNSALQSAQIGGKAVGDNG